MSEIEEFRERVERFLDRHEVTPTEFGKRFASDPGFVFGLREGREPRTQTRRKIESRMMDFAAPATTTKNGEAA